MRVLQYSTYSLSFQLLAPENYSCRSYRKPRPLPLPRDLVHKCLKRCIFNLNKDKFYFANYNSHKVNHVRWLSLRIQFRFFFSTDILKIHIKRWRDFATDEHKSGKKIILLKSSGSLVLCSKNELNLLSFSFDFSNWFILEFEGINKNALHSVCLWIYSL